jgi:hypothetical protein
MFKKCMLRKIFEPKREDGGNCVVRSFMVCNPHQILLFR